MTKTLHHIIEDDHRIDKTIGEETIDIKVMEPEMIVEIEADRVNYRSDFSNDRNRGGVRDRSRMRERSLTPRRDDRRFQSPNSNSGTRNKCTSRVTMNRDRGRCYKCKECDHFGNECPKFCRR